MKLLIFLTLSSQAMADVTINPVPPVQPEITEQIIVIDGREIKINIIKGVIL